MTQRFSLMQRMMASATPFSVFFEIVPPQSRDFSHELGGTVFFFTSSFANACSEVYNEAKEVSIMLKAYQFRLYPNREQKIYFANCFGCARFIFNQMLADRKEIYEKHKDDKELLRSIKPRTYTSFKDEFPFLKEVDNLVLANASQNLNKAYQNFFRDKSVGFSKFKAKHKSKASYTTNNQGGNIRIEDGKIKLPKIGFVTINQHRDFDGLIKSCTISMNKAGNYFIFYSGGTGNA